MSSILESFGVAGPGAERERLINLFMSGNLAEALPSWPKWASDKRPNSGYPRMSISREAIEYMIDDLAKSGLVPDDVGAYPTWNPWHTASYCIPYPEPGKVAYTHASRAMYVCKFNRKDRKYLGPAGRSDVWTPLGQARLPAKGQAVWIIEGEKKAAAAYKLNKDIFVIGIRGCAGFYQPKDLRPKGKEHIAYLHVYIAECVVIGPSSVVCVFDNDIRKGHIRLHALRLNNAIKHLVPSTEVRVVKPRNKDVKGLDDAIQQSVGTGIRTLESLIQDVVDIDLRTYLPNNLILNKTTDGIIPSDFNTREICNLMFGEFVIKDFRRGLLFDDGRNVAQEPDAEGDSDAEVPEVTASEATLIEDALDLFQSPVYLGNPKWSKSMVRNGVQGMLAKLPTRDLVLEEVQSYTWDGVRRLYPENLKDLSTFKGVGRTILFSSMPKLADEVIRVAITALTFRIKGAIELHIHPVIQGPQNAGKSTLCKNLSYFGGREYYRTITKYESEDNTNRTIGPRARASVVLEFAESANFNLGKLANQEEFKEYLARKMNFYRESHGKRDTEVPFRNIFIFTANHKGLLYDRTGARRYLPITIDAVADHWRSMPGYDLDLTERMLYERNQMVAEVLARQGELSAFPWWEPAMLHTDLDDECAALYLTMSPDTSAIDVVRASFQAFDEVKPSIFNVIDDVWGRMLIDKKEPSARYIPADILFQHFVTTQAYSSADDITSARALSKALPELSKGKMSPYVVLHVDKTARMLELPEKPLGGLEAHHLKALSKDYQNQVKYLKITQRGEHKPTVAYGGANQ